MSSKKDNFFKLIFPKTRSLAIEIKKKINCGYIYFLIVKRALSITKRALFMTKCTP